MRYKYASVDLETTGLDPRNDQILEFGIVLDDLESPIEKLPMLNLFIAHHEIHGSPIAISMNRRLIEQLADYHQKQHDPECRFVEEDELGANVAGWLESECGWDGKSKLTFAGKNFATFDAMFLHENGFFGDVPMRHRVIDPANMYWNPAVDGGKLPSMSECMARAGMPTHVAHRALDDAITVVQLIRYKHGIPHTIGNPN